MNSKLDALLDKWLAACVSRDASDLHLVAGLPPHLRVHGELTAISGEPELTASALRAIADDLLDRMARRNEEARMCLDIALSAKGSFDGAMTAPDQTRFRFNLFRRTAISRLPCAASRIASRPWSNWDCRTRSTVFAICGTA